MGQIKRLKPVKLFAGFIFRQDYAFKKAMTVLEARFGRCDFESEPIAFTHTDYYENEFGKGLTRKFLSFPKLIPPDELSSIKAATNRIEKKLSKDGSRLVNIDPGYLDLGKAVLATTKDYNHRIYLARGIYAEVTLYYRDKTFTPWDWTYPDYRTPEYIDTFNKIRSLYAEQIKDL